MRGLFYLSNNPKVLKHEKHLIEDIVDDVIQSIKSSLKGEEIDLKSFAIKKGLKILKFALSLSNTRLNYKFCKLFFFLLLH